MRVVEPGPTRVALEVAIRRMEPSEGVGPTIRLVGVAHIGDAEYYRRIQRHLDEHEVVLYEAVGGLSRLDDDATEQDKKKWTRQAMGFTAQMAEEYRAERGSYPPTLGLLRQWAKGHNTLLASWLGLAATDGWGKLVEYRRQGAGITLTASGGVKVARRAAAQTAEPGEDWSAQGELAEALGLAFQLDAMDYDRPHFRHSDLPLGKLGSRLGGEAEEGDDAEIDMMVQLMRGKGVAGGLLKFVIDFMKASPRLAGLTKAVLIEVLGNVKGDLSEAAGMPPGMREMMRSLIRDRNQIVIGDLRRLLDAAAPPRSIAVFYGAAHMHDLEARIVAELGYRPVEDEWLPVMSADGADSGLSAENFRSMRAVLRFQMQQAFSPRPRPAEPASTKDQR
jgi:hypothetical protein